MFRIPTSHAITLATTALATGSVTASAAVAITYLTTKYPRNKPPPSSLLAAAEKHPYKDAFCAKVAIKQPSSLSQEDLITALVASFHTSPLYTLERNMISLYRNRTLDPQSIEGTKAIAIGDTMGAKLWTVIGRAPNEVLYQWAPADATRPNAFAGLTWFAVETDEKAEVAQANIKSEGDGKAEPAQANVKSEGGGKAEPAQDNTKNEGEDERYLTVWFGSGLRERVGSDEGSPQQM
ncbi:hypothetical protein HK104_006974, partial [Borealophlyctis nickersoniae]